MHGGNKVIKHYWGVYVGWEDKVIKHYWGVYVGWVRGEGEIK